MARPLADYFQPLNQVRALESYRTFATGAAWSVQVKVDLYVESRKAFDKNQPDASAFAAFEVIYQNLVSHWQVFRPQGAKGSWPARQIFDTIKQHFIGFGWGDEITLKNFGDSRQQNALMFSLIEMGGIKPTNNYPIMAVSKFMHFYNPSLFPIYDTEIICNRVFKCFKKDYAEFCSDAKYAGDADGATFLRNYIDWASSLVASAHPEFIATFVEWLRSELPPRSFDAIGQEAMKTLYATAFEFIAIGATIAEGF